MKTIKIFLASSEELKQERLELADLVENLNQRLGALDLHIQLVKWEYLDASMGSKHKQEEYNEALRSCEMCLVLYWTRFGDYTTEELDIAYQELCAGHNPQKLYVYFKEGAEPSPELKAFRDAFPERYGHFFNHFQNTDTLKAEFLLQFIDYQKNHLQNNHLVEVKDGQVTVDGKMYVDLKNVPFAGNNEEYNLLMKSIKKTQKLLSVTEPDDPEYREYAIELSELKERQQLMENSLWDTALMITQLSTTQCSERLKRAMDLFSQGNNKGALAILNEEEIDRDINHNLQLIQLGEEGKKGLSVNIDEMLLKIKALETERKEGWYKDVDHLYNRCIEIGRGNLTTLKTIGILSDYGTFLRTQNQFEKAESAFKEALNFGAILKIEDSQSVTPITATILNNLAIIYFHCQRNDESEKIYKEVLEIRKQLALENPQIYEPDLATTLNNLANLYYDTERLRECEELYKESLEIRRRLAISNPQAYEYDYAATLSNLASLYSYTKRFDESEKMSMEALTILQRLVKQNPQLYSFAPVNTLANLGTLYYRTKRFEDSEKMYKEALEINRQIATLNPQAYEPRLASTLYNLACLYYNTEQRFDECEKLYKEALIIRKRLANDNPKTHERDVAKTLKNLASLYSDIQRFEESDEMYRQAIEILRRLAADDQKAFNSDLAGVLGDWAFLKNKLGQFDKAEQLSNEGISIDSSQHFLYTNLATALLLQGKYKEAEAIYRKYKDELKESFLGDFEELESLGSIPEEYKADAERIKKMLSEE